MAFVLASIDYFDELASGLPSAGAPALTGALSTGVAGLALSVLTVPGLVALVVDAPLVAWASRHRRAPMIALGLAGMGVSLLAGGFAPSLWTLALAAGIFSPASGLACGLAQAALVDEHREERERGMADWAFAGTLGDLAAPLAVALGAALFGSWRAAWLCVGASLLLLAVLVYRLPLGHAPFAERGEEAKSLLHAFREPGLVRWVLGAALCALLDETFTALAALWLSERFPRAPLAVPIGLGAGTLGGLLGLIVLKRLLGTRSPLALLALSSVGTIAAYGAWLASGSLAAAAAWLFAVGALVSWQYPLAQARAYRAAGERSGLVAALAPLANGLDLVAPLVVGLVADRYGVALALACLLIQPAGLLAAVSRELRR